MGESSTMDTEERAQQTANQIRDLGSEIADISAPCSPNQQNAPSSKGSISRLISMVATLVMFLFTLGSWIYIGIYNFAEDKIMKEQTSRFEKQIARIDHASNVANLTLVISILETKKTITKSDSSALLQTFIEIEDSSSITKTKVFGLLINKAISLIVTSGNTEALLKLMETYKDELARQPSALVTLLRYFFLEYLSDYTLASGDTTKLDASTLRELIERVESNANEGVAEFYKVMLSSSEVKFDFNHSTSIYLSDLLANPNGKPKAFWNEMDWVLSNSESKQVHFFLAQFTENYNNELHSLH